MYPPVVIYKDCNKKKKILKLWLVKYGDVIKTNQKEQIK